MIDQKLLFSIIEGALKDLYEQDIFLLEHDVNARSISHKLASYIEQRLSALKLEDKWDVDCEYNRLGDKKVKNHWRSKTLNLPVDYDVPSDDTKAKTVFPDINIHHRGKEGKENNLLVIEIKKSSEADEHDFNKLEQYGAELEYKWGVYLNLQPKQTTGFWWKDGKPQPNLANGEDGETFFLYKPQAEIE